MGLLDMRTVIFSIILTFLICTLVITFLWNQNRKRFRGTGFWVANFILQTIGLILISLRGQIPDVISIVLSNTFIITGAFLGLAGIKRFLEIQSTYIFNITLIIVFSLIHAWFAFGDENLAARNLNISVAMLIICMQCGWILLFKTRKETRKITAGVGIVFVLFSLVNLVRIIAFFTHRNSTNDYFLSGAFEVWVLLSFQVFFILLTFFLNLMFNKRLMMDLALNEEKFSKAFKSSPYAIVLSRLRDGKILEVNEGFTLITGYQHSETIGNTAEEMNLWQNRNDRIQMVQELRKFGRVQNHEFAFRKKSGEMITGLMSSEIIKVNYEDCVLSSINDITDRILAEKEIRLNEKRLKSLLKISHADAKSVQEILDSAINEAIGLTESKLGYIFLYNEEKQEFTLISRAKWSTKLQKNSESETVFDLDNSGLFGEAVRQRGPVMMNNIEDGKFSFNGNTMIRNLLTTPVFIDKQIVAVVGVANKKTDFTKTDINQLSLLIDPVWNITEKIRIKESLKETEAILKAAMDCSQAGIAIANAPDGQLRYVNRAGLMIPAKDEDELVDGIDINKYVGSWKIKHFDGTPFNPDEVPLARAVLYGETNSREFIISRENNDDRFVLANAAPILNDSGSIKAGIVVFLDITERKNAEKLLNDKLSELERFNKIMVGRELKMIELKAEINELCRLLHTPERYKTGVKSQ